MSQLQIMALPVGALETNCYILYDCPGGSGYVVDPGDEPQRLLQAVQALSLHILGVVLTHAHFGGSPADPRPLRPYAGG